MGRGVRFPLSQALTERPVVPSLAASCSWVSPRSLRRAAKFVTRFTVPEMRPLDNRKPFR